MNSGERIIRRRQIAYYHFVEDYDIKELEIMFSVPIKAIRQAIKKYKHLDWSE
jgi:hypothetical protein